MKWKEKARQLKTEVYVLYLALRDPRTPWYAKALAVIIVAYALSPIDLIPDFIPVLGYLDDLILIPAGIYLALKMIPKEVLEEHRQKAKSEAIARKSRWVVAILIILIWLLVLYLIIKIIWL
jgi:uncharacterized membrane protein YkvA (DUF1232 family)